MREQKRHAHDSFCRPQNGRRRVPASSVCTHFLAATVFALLCIPWFATQASAYGYRSTPEGVWLGTEKQTLCLKNGSLTPWFLNLAAVGLIESGKLINLPARFTQYLPPLPKAVEPLGYGELLGLCASLAGCGWSLVNLLESFRVFPWQVDECSVVVDLAYVSHRLQLQLNGPNDRPTLVFIRNPLADAADQPASDLDPVSRALLAIHSNMVKGDCERLEISSDHNELGIVVAWRNSKGHWQKLLVPSLLSETKSPELCDVAGPAGELLQMLQPGLLARVGHILQTGQSTDMPEEVFERSSLAVKQLGSDLWSVALNSDKNSVVLLEGYSRSHEKLPARLRLYRADSAAPVARSGSLYTVPQHWSAAVRLLLNAGTLLLGARPLLSAQTSVPLSTATVREVPKRLDLIKTGEAGAAALGAGVAAQGKGTTFSYRLVPSDDEYNRRGRLKDSNRVILGDGTLRDFVEKGVELPYQLELTGTDGRTVYAMPYDETAPEGAIMLSNHLREALGLEYGNQVTVRPVKPLPAAQLAKVEVVSGPYREESELVDMIGAAMNQRYPVLHNHERIRVADGHNEWTLRVNQLQPAEVVSTINVNLEMVLEYPEHWDPASSPGIGELGHLLGTGEHVEPPLPQPRLSGTTARDIPPSSDIPPVYSLPERPSVQLEDSSTQTMLTAPYAVAPDLFEQVQNDKKERDQLDAFANCKRKVGKAKVEKRVTWGDDYKNSERN